MNRCNLREPVRKDHPCRIREPVHRKLPRPVADRSPDHQVVRHDSDDPTGARAGGRTNKPLAEALSDLMKERGVSQMDLASLTGLSPMTIDSCLGRRSSQSMELASAIASQEMANAVDIRPGHFPEYRLRRIIKVMRDLPGLADCIYDLLVAEADLLDSQGKDREAS